MRYYCWKNRRQSEFRSAEEVTETSSPTAAVAVRDFDFTFVKVTEASVFLNSAGSERFANVDVAELQQA